VRTTSTGPIRTFLIGGALTATAFSTAADAQDVMKRRQDRPQATNRTEDVAAKKAADEAYQKALKNIPDASKKKDPWGTLR
jgi:hypothetical protein